jgi:outer membrane protein assembly factor BamA
MISGVRGARGQRVWPAARAAAAGVAVALLALGSEAWAGGAASIDEYVGKPVLEVRFVSEGRPVPDSALLDLVETRVGPPLSMRQIRESLLHLFTLGRFQDVQVHATPLQQGVALRYELIPLQVVERLEFQGLLGLSRRRLRGAIVERYGPNPRFDVVDEAVQALTELYRDEGYLNARVVGEVERSPEGDTMAFAINAGARVRIGTVDVEGAPLGPPAQVLARLNVRPGQVYDREAIERRLSDYESDCVQQHVAL